nr:hypothetical protein [Tanacetum cinerariifolium]
MADDGNESSDAYCSSDEEDLSYVDFHTKLDDNVVINTVTTNDLYLNKLCGDNVDFIILVDEPMNANVDTVEKMKPVLEMRFHHPEQLKMCLANYGIANRYPLWFYRNDWRKLLVYCSRDVESGRCARADSLKKEKERVGEKFLFNVSLGHCKRAKQRALFDYEGGLREHYERLWEYRRAILDSNPVFTCRLDGDIEVEDNYRSNAKLGIPSVDPIEVVTPTANKGKKVAKPSEEHDLQPLPKTADQKKCTSIQ